MTNYQKIMAHKVKYTKTETGETFKIVKVSRDIYHYNEYIEILNAYESRGEISDLEVEPIEITDYLTLNELLSNGEISIKDFAYLVVTLGRDE
jgi:ABC-type metal ion transport system substrate-binding protein